MSPSARREYVSRMQVLYRQSQGRREKGRLLNQVCETLGRSRRQAKRLMRHPPRPKGAFRRREAVYPERLVSIVESVWEATQRAWSVRLKAALPLWMPWIKKRWALSEEDERLLLAMSPATIDRRLAAHRNAVRRRVYGKTKPGHWLMRTIPIQTEWNVREVGWVEADTVSHAGGSAAGVFASTLSEVELFSGWVELGATLGKGATDIAAAADRLKADMPFEQKGMDTDCGEEFINYTMETWCRDNHVRRFRSRPYKKDDQAHIEQKNGTHVRRLIGWDRYDTQAAVDAINDLYRNEWRLLTNLFLPSVKLQRKLRVASRIKRLYHEAQTPLDRLWESGQGHREKLLELRHRRLRLDPFDLACVVERKLQRIWSLASRSPSASAPRASTKRWPSPSEYYPPPLFVPHSNCDIKRLRAMHWKDHYFGTN